MNHFSKALKSFNKRAVLQKAAVGKPRGSFVNSAGQTVHPFILWDVVVPPGIVEARHTALKEGFEALGDMSAEEAQALREFHALSPEEQRTYLEGKVGLIRGHQRGLIRRSVHGTDVNPIHALREAPSYALDGKGGRNGRSLRAFLSPERRAMLDRIDGGFISESTVETGDVGIVSYGDPHRSKVESDLYCKHFGVDPGRFGSATSLASLLESSANFPCSPSRKVMFAGTELGKLVNGQGVLIVRPALTISYEEAYTLLRLHLYDKMKKDGLEYRALITAPYTPAKHPHAVRKVFMPYLQQLLDEGADHLAPYFAEKFGDAF